MARDRSQDPRTPDPAGPAPDEVQYGAAVLEIEQILSSIDRDEIDLDLLGQKVERAVELLKVCRARLKATEARVTQVLKDLAQEEAAEQAEPDDEPPAQADPPGEPRSADPPAADAEGAKRRSRRRKDDRDDDEELPF